LELVAPVDHQVVAMAAMVEAVVVDTETLLKPLVLAATVLQLFASTCEDKNGSFCSYKRKCC
jgi:hypothetical protein